MSNSKETSPLPRKLITVQEAAKQLNLEPATIYQGRGGTVHLRRVRRGAKVLLDADEVLKLKQATPNDELMDVVTAAAILQVSISSIYQGTAGTGPLRKVRMGDKIQLIKREVMAMANRRGEPHPRFGDNF